MSHAYSQPTFPQREAREVALLGLAVPLTDAMGRPIGPPVLPATPWHLVLLGLYRNPFYLGTAPCDLGAVLQYVWLHTPQFWAQARPWDPAHQEAPAWRRRWAFRRFRWRWAPVLGKLQRHAGRWQRGPRVEALAAIQRHAAAAVLDRPKFARRVETGPVPATSAAIPSESGPHELAHLALLAGRLAGIREPDFWLTPLGRTNQLLAIAARSLPQDPKAPRFDPETDRQIGAYLRAKKAARAAKPAR